jgi:hypothetical protein
MKRWVWSLPVLRQIWKRMGTRGLRMIEVALLMTLILMLLSAGGPSRATAQDEILLWARCADAGCPACPLGCEGYVNPCQVICYDGRWIRCGSLGCP